MTGVIDATSKVNGVDKTNGQPIDTSQVEAILKGMIHKHLDNKKQAKKGAKKNSPQAAPAPEAFAQQAPVDPLLQLAHSSLSSNLAINWDENAEARDLLNERIPGGTESVDALIRLIQERRAAN